MKRLSKRSWALALALAMVLSLFTGISAKAEPIGQNDPLTVPGLYMVSCHWEDNEYVLDEYIASSDYGMPVWDDRTYYLSTMPMAYGMYSPFNNDDFENLKLYSVSEGEDPVEIERIDNYIRYTGEPGVYNIRLDDLGHYQLVETVKNYTIDIWVNLPDLGVYTSQDTFDMDTLISGSFVDNYIEAEQVYYIHALTNSDPRADWIVSSKINSITAWSEYFGRQYQIDDIEFENVDASTVKMTIPKDFSRNFYINGNFERTRHEGDGFAKDTWDDYRIDINPQLRSYSGVCANWAQREGFGDGEDWEEFFRFRYTDFWEFPKVINGTSNDDMYLSIAERTLDDPEDEESWKITPVTDPGKFSVTNYDGAPVSADSYEIDDYGWSQEVADYVDSEHQDEPGWSPEGVFRLRFKNPGKYKVCYDGEEESYFIVDVEARDCAMYSKNESGDYDFIAGPWEDYFYTPGETVYIMLSDQMKQIIMSDEKLESATVDFKDELNMDSIDWMATDFEPIEVHIPASLSINLWDSIWLNVRYNEMVEHRDDQGNTIYDDDGQPEMVQREEGWAFRLNADETGIVVAGCDGDGAGNNTAIDPNAPRNVDDDGEPIPGEDGEYHYRSEEFGKRWDSGAFDEPYLSLGIKDADGSVDLLQPTEETINKFSVIDAYGKVLEPEMYEIRPATYYDDQAGEEVAYDDLFTVSIKKTGIFGIQYTDSGNTSMFTYYVSRPEVMLYDQNVKRDEFMLGYDAKFAPNRRTFYILPDNYDNIDNERQEGGRREITIKAAYAEPESYWVISDENPDDGHWEQYDIDIDQIEIENNKNFVKITVPEEFFDDEVMGQAYFRIKIFFSRINQWYDHFDDDDGHHVEFRTDVNRTEWRNFNFSPNPDDIPYPEEAEKDLIAAQAVIDMIEELPNPSEVTVDDKEDIEAARAAFEELTEEQKELVEAENYGKLLDDEDALITALAKRAEDEEIVNDFLAAVNDLPDNVPDLEDYDDPAVYKEAVYNLEADIINVRMQYDMLTDDQKDLVEAQVLLDIDNLEEALEDAIIAIKKSETIEKYVADTALENALLDLASAIVDGESFIETFGESEYADKEEIQEIASLDVSLNELIVTLNDLANKPDATNKEKLDAAESAANLIGQQEAAIKTARDTIASHETLDQQKTIVKKLLLIEFERFNLVDYEETDYDYMCDLYDQAIINIDNAATYQEMIDISEDCMENIREVKTIAQKEADQEADSNVTAALQVGGRKLNEKDNVLNRLSGNEFVTEGDLAEVTKAFDNLSDALEELNGLEEDATNDEKNVAAELVKQAVDVLDEAIDSAEENAEKAENEDVAQKVASQIAELKAIEDITPADRESIDAARAAYDDLTPEQKALIDADVVTKLNKSEAAVQTAEEVEKTKKEDAEKAAKDAEEAAKQAEADKNSAVEKAKKEAAEASKASKDVPPVAGTIIYDAKTKAIYKVLTPSAKDKVGTVEYKRPEGSPKKANIPETITVNNFKYDVTAIGAGAFEDCAKLKSVTVPSKVTIIGARAFAGCGKLKLIKVKSTVLKKVGAKALNKINKKAKVKVPKAQKKAYKKLFKKKGQPKSVKIK